ncbi:phasin family protein [Croceicoccus bisphenolivorans]|uniref:phasin family protein n=1 Tax=Croceicoccus bisphenolivorans TaxID=1783232 RepID=UPI0008354E35|nr:phasin family protein [Croceicoccus bisphenolivorans]
MAQSKDKEAGKPKAPVAAKPKTTAKPEAAPVTKADPAPEPVAAKAPEPVVEKPAAPKAVKPAPKRTYKPRQKTSAAKAAVAKPQVKKAASKPAAKPAAEPAPQKAAVAATVAAPAPSIAAVASKPAKDTIKITQEFVKMTTPETLTKGLQTAMADVTAKSKEAYEKGTVMMADATEFTKGNVEAMVESSKIFASGMQEMGRSFVADSKAEFEALTAEVKELASVKSPTDFFQLQSAMMRKYFDKSVAAASKNTEAMLKLANDAAQPLSSRVSVAMEKMKAA